MEGKPPQCFFPSHIHPVDVMVQTPHRLIGTSTTSSQPDWWWCSIMWHYITLTGFDTLPNHVFRDILFFIPSSAAKWFVVPPDVIHKCQHLFSSIVMKRWLDRWFRSKMKLGGVGDNNHCWFVGLRIMESAARPGQLCSGQLWGDKDQNPQWETQNP